jgi:hypothetical protein
MSGKKSKKSSSPNELNFKDLNLNDEKKIETVFELIDKLPPDMQNEVFNKLLSYNPSNANSRKLSLVNNEFADTYSITRQLSKIKSKSPKKLPIKSLSKRINTVVAMIGDLKIKTLEKYSPVKDLIYEMFHYSKIQSPENQDEEADIYNMFAYDTLAEAKEAYESYTNLKDFENKKNEFIESWNFQNSDGDYRMLGMSQFDRLGFIQTKIKEHRKYIEDYDPENAKKDKPKIDAFLKINKNNTYAEYIKAIRDLPFSAKVIVG